ncbi:MAG: alpha-ketoacid dehydrogenase subunit beta [Rhodocyclaceae bacterium]|nr:alpha-ketoacid dehydrogenase subunit beta [Rhodocyclaceae bacterium]MCA3344292.1 alpha-ketoacid dehydrogenase subunit beta [Roseomonas sp.]MCA3653308.1 alpha-ketoacid dehydrogenase subunit beta [Methylobacterium sp.]
MPVMTYAEAIRDALSVALAQDPSVIVYGLGAPDPKGVFGTTLDLHKEYGSRRVFDMPTSENAMTGIGIGASLGGLRPVLTHQRLDFALLSLDQIINNAAKWRFMFGGQRSVPITIRMILGRGWGQGPTHSQNLQALFAHIPGLCVVMPTTPEDAKGLLLTSIFGEDPVIFLEHRWLHNLSGETPQGDHRIPLGKARMMRSGGDVTVVAMSIMSIEAAHAVDHLAAQGITCDLIDLRSIRPIDWPMIEASVRRTGRLLALDSGHETGGVAGEIVAHVATKCWGYLRSAPRRLAMPDVPEATSPALTKDYHVRAEHVADAIAALVGREAEFASLADARKHPHDVPGDWFKGPF